MAIASSSFRQASSGCRFRLFYEQGPSASTRFPTQQTPHVEKHFTASETVRDIVIGMSDGLTVPFALAAGLSGVVEASAIAITAGLGWRRRRLS
jgi:hypothetical protein